MKRVLLVEDEPTIRTAVRDALRAKGYDVDDTIDGSEAIRRCRAQTYDLILLDVMLPGADGFEVCKTLRREGNRTPILMLTARGSEDDRVKGLALGADDYIPKPFSVRELLARVEAHLRRTDWGAPQTGLCLIKTERVEIDLSRLECRVEGGEARALTPREGEILKYLAEHPDRVVSRQEFLIGVWGYPAGTTVQTRTVENTIGKLRQKIEVDRKQPEVVQTVHGAGWKLGEGVTCGDS